MATLKIRGGSMSGTPQFVDISVFNPTDIDWQAYKAWSANGDGISRVAMRSSYGVGFEDQHFAVYRTGALAAGIDCIFYYHFGYPEYNTAVAEANWQQQVVGGIRESDMIILDYEEEVQAATAEWAYDWLQHQETLYGRPPGIYSSSAYIETRLQDARLARFPLWLANWQYSPDERPAIPSPWTSYAAIQYTDRATDIPGIPGAVDADIFLAGGNMQTYGPGKGDFDTWFTVDANGNWICKQTNTLIMGGNLALYSQLSIDGNSLPILGLPRTNEIYQTDATGYSWSVQFFERGLIVYDPQHKQDSQPGLGSSYIGKYPQFILLDPEATTVVAVPSAVIADIKQLYKDAGIV
jgi:GH25 family lysozyme M1 (1,4-beta-N-acetylmuramidase)